MVQLAESSTMGPCKAEVWDFFINKIVPVISKWQLEATRGHEEVADNHDSDEMVNTALQGIVETLKDKTIVQVIKKNWLCVRVHVQS